MSDEVVRRVIASEVIAAEVDHLIGTERPHELELVTVVDTGHLRTEPFSQLDGE
jgi:pyrimidine operon attenuation protein/uracil phosphoribosyltransferase